MSFFDLGLNPLLVQQAQALGLNEPSAIQAQAIPRILAGRDVLGCAPTGSGKTFSYLLPLVQRWLADAKARTHTGFVRPLTTLIVVPTRELAMQVYESLCDLVMNLREPPRTCVVYGGVSINPQMMRLRGSADFLVTTPGRLLDLFDHHAVKLHQVRHLVLDEADRLLEPGFAQEMNDLLDLLPTQRQTLLFSATFPSHVEDFAEHELHEAERIEVDAADDAEHASSPDSIEQRAIAVDSTRRTQLLRQLIEQAGCVGNPAALAPQLQIVQDDDGAHAGDVSEADGGAVPADCTAANRQANEPVAAMADDAEPVSADWSRVLVFVAKRYTAELLADKLYAKGIKATTFHGDMSQGARNTVLAEFKEKRWQVLITTDLAARGIDIAKLPVVVNYDLPRSAADYVHRIGRTGRAGQTGLAISLVTPADMAHWALIQKRNGLCLPPEVLHGYETTELPPPPPVGDDNGGIKGRRLSKKDKLRMAQARTESEQGKG